MAASIGFAVCAITGCGSSGKLLSASQASALSDQLQRISAAVNDGDCTAAENDLTNFEDRVASLNGVNSTLVSNLNQGANTIETLTQTKCTVATTTTRTKPKKTHTNTTTTNTSTDTNTDTNTVTTPTNTDTVNTNTYTTQTYTAPYTDTQTSTTGGSGLDVPTYTATTTTTTTTTPTTGTTDTTDTTGGTAYGDSSTAVGSATSYNITVRDGHHRPRGWEGGF